MTDATWFRIAADAVLYLHALFVVFVVGGLLVIIIGKLRDWNRVYDVRFRIVHLLAIAVVVLQAWLGAICPLTRWETELRARAGDASYDGAFIAHWVEELLYYHAPDWVFTLVYSVFGALVIASWYWVRPRR